MRVIHLADCHALHLYQPAGTADGSMDDDIGLAMEPCLIHLVYQLIVRGVTQIDYHIAHIVVGAFRLGKKGLHILPHTLCLLDDILGIFDLALVVDTCRTRDKHMAAVLIVNTGATLETHPIVAGAVEVGRGIEVVYLLLLDACDGIVVHLRQHVRVSLSATDTRRGDEVCVDGESLCEEELVTGTDNTPVVKVHVIDEEPKVRMQLSFRVHPSSSSCMLYSLKSRRVWYSELAARLWALPFHRCLKPLCSTA